MRDWKLLPALITGTLVVGIGGYVAFYFLFLDFSVAIVTGKQIGRAHV